MKDLAPVYKALGDETRLAIMALLVRHGELCVCDFEGVLGISQSKSSRHLRYLLNAGLVQNRREGVWMHYRVVTEPDERMGSILASLSETLTGSEYDELLERLDEWLAAKGQQGQPCRNG